MAAARSRVPQWLFAWAGARAEPETVLEPRPPMDLDAIRCHMVRSVEGCSDHHRARAADKVMAARTVLELWMLRCDLHQFLARDFGELEAGRRMDRLKALFEGHELPPARAPLH
jgi:hypothetical protein